MSNSPQTIIDFYLEKFNNISSLEILDFAGNGGFGHVYKATMNHKVYGVQLCAVKIGLFENGNEDNRPFDGFFNDYGSPLHIKIVINEIEKMKEATSKSKYFPSYYDHILDEEKGVYIIVEEYCFPCEKFLEGKKGVALEKEVIKLGKDVLEGLIYLSGHKILHRDIKPANILCSVDNTTGEHIYKICDFGACSKNKNNKGIVDRDTTTSLLTKFYCPDEAYYNINYHYRAWDTFSLGVTMFVLLVGEFPFKYEEQDPNSPELVPNVDGKLHYNRKYNENDFNKVIKNKVLSKVIQNAIALDEVRRYYDPEHMQLELDNKPMDEEERIKFNKNVLAGKKETSVSTVPIRNSISKKVPIIFFVVAALFVLVFINKADILDVFSEKDSGPEESTSSIDDNNDLIANLSDEDNSQTPSDSNLKDSDTIQENNDYDKYVGTELSLGSYEQDNDVDDGLEPIEWMVIGVEDDKALLLSKYVIDNFTYSESSGDISWENSFSREYLNSSFYDVAFNDFEKNLILSTELNNSNDDWEEGAYSGNDTIDKIFYLSRSQILKYLPNTQDRRTTATAYAIDNDVIHSETSCEYWLRNNGISEESICSINNDGEVVYKGSYSLYIGVRPAMYIGVEDLKSLISENNIAMNNNENNQNSQMNEYRITSIGSYDMDMDPSNGLESIEWYIVDETENHYILVSRDCIDAMEMDSTEGKEVTWENSELRKWLNSTFYDSAFSDEEKDKIVLSEVEASDNVYYGSFGGNSTEDYVYLLSEDECKEYIYSKGITTNITKYAFSIGVDKTTRFWLRTPGLNQWNSEFGFIDGAVETKGWSNSNKLYVRPVIRIRKD